MNSKNVLRPLLTFFMAFVMLMGAVPIHSSALVNPSDNNIYLDGEPISVDDERVLNIVNVSAIQPMAMAIAPMNASAKPNVSSIAGISADFSRDPSITMNGARVSARRYIAQVDGIGYESYCADPNLRGPESDGAVYELVGEASAQLRNALKNGFPVNSEWSGADLDTEERMWWAYVTRVAVAMANHPTRTYAGEALVLEQARSLANGSYTANHAAYPGIMVNGEKDTSDTGRIIHGSNARSESFNITYNRKTNRYFNPFTFEWAAGTPVGARLIVDGSVIAIAPVNPTRVFRDDITSFQIEMPNNANFRGKTAAVNLVGIHNQFADRVWMMQNPNDPTGWQDIVFYIPEISASAAFSFTTETEEPGPEPTPEPITPTMTPVSVVIQKIDALTRENIPGALMRLRGMTAMTLVTGDGQVFTVNNTGVNISQVLTAGATTAAGEDITSTVADGVWSIEGLPYGFYMVEEERAPHNYSLLPQHTAYGFWVVPPDVTVTAEGTPIISTDSETISGEGFYWSVTVETVEFIDIEYEIVLSPNPTSVLLTFENYPFGQIEVSKHDEITGATLAGAHFRIQGYFPEGNENGIPIDRVGITGGDGRVVFDNLPAGQYTISEIQAPMGYQLDSTQFRSIPLTWGQSASTSFQNIPKTFFEVLKIDGDSGSPLSGAVFELRDPATGETWQGTTNGSGIAILGRGTNGNELSHGRTYILTEIQTPAGYVLIEEPIGIVLSAGGSNRATVRNYRNPSLTIIKRDRETGQSLAGAVFTVIYENGQSVSGSPFTTDSSGQIVLPWTLFQNNPERTLIVTEIEPPPGYVLSDPNWQRVTMRSGENNVVTFENLKKPTLTLIKYDELTNLPLAGATFRLWRTEGETWEEAQITDANGRIVWTDLDPGIYSVQEIDEPYGYFRDPARKEILLEGGDNKQLTFFNRPRPVLTILKRDQVTGEPLQGVMFRVQRLEGQTIGEFLTDVNGMIEISPRTGYLLEEKIYRVTEVTPPIEYLLDANPVKDALLKWYEPTELIFENLLKPTLIFTKTNAMTGRGITGATYRIQYEAPNGGIINLGTYITRCGLIVLPHVQPGWYIITEISPAPGYSLPTNPVTRVFLSPGENSYTFAQTQVNLYVDPRTNPANGSRGNGGDWCGHWCSRLCGSNCGHPGCGGMAIPGGGSFGNITITNGQGQPIGTITNPSNPGDNPGGNQTKPTLTAGAVTRNSNLSAAVSFTSSAAGRYFYTVVDSGANEPIVPTTGLGTVCVAGVNNITVFMTAGAKDVYIRVRDLDGNISDALKIAIPAFAAQTQTAEPPPNFDNVVITGGTIVFLNPDFPGITITFGNQP